MDKFNRVYELAVQTPSGSTITIALPFTIEFDITRNVLSSANVCSIRIYNLSAKNRNQIRKDAWQINSLELITLKGGYGKNLSTIFTGSVTKAWSVREGNNFITQIECFDGGFAFANGTFNGTFPQGTSQSDMIAELMKALPGGVSIGAIGAYPGTISRANTLSGNTTDILNQITGGGFFIDNGVAHALKDNECLAGQIAVISSASGLLGTPLREELTLTFDILFEPRLEVAQRILLDSVTGANFNSYYKVVGLKHRGTISGAVAGDAITTITVFAQDSLQVVSP